MKKLVLIAVMVLVAVLAQAQFYVGGILGVSVNSNKVKSESNTTQTYAISPEFGYKFNSVWAIGLSLGAGYASVGGGDDYTVLGVSPYVRATYAHIDRVYFFADAAFIYENTKEHTYHTNVNGWGAGLCPGILIDLGKNMQLLARTTLLQYVTVGDAPYKTKQAGFSIGDNLDLVYSSVSNEETTLKKGGVIDFFALNGVL